MPSVSLPNERRSALPLSRARIGQDVYLGYIDLQDEQARSWVASLTGFGHTTTNPQNWPKARPAAVATPVLG